MAKSRKNERNQKREAQGPAFIAYHVVDRGEGDSKKSFWTRIGAAWDHDDGKGFTLDLELVPVNGGRIVVREPSEAEDRKSA
jgi:hypothetical protein